MMTSACGPAATASASSALTCPPMATTPPNALSGSHSRARSYALIRSPDTAAPHGLACLMMATTATSSGPLPPAPPASAASAASAANSCTSRHAASPSKRLRYDSAEPPCCSMESHQLGAPASR